MQAGSNPEQYSSDEGGVNRISFAAGFIIFRWKANKLHHNAAIRAVHQGKHAERVVFEETDRINKSR